MIDVKKAVRVSVAQLVELLADTAFVAKVAKCHIDAETVNLPTAKELVSLDPYLAVGVVLETVDGELFTVGYQKTSPVEADAWVKENVLPPIRQYELLSAD